MKGLLLGSLVVFILFSVHLVGGKRTAQTLEKTRQQAARVLPEDELRWSLTKAQTYTARTFEFAPPQMSPRAARKAGIVVELVAFRGVLLWHALPILSLPFVIGVLEGSWARQNQQALVRIHSPLQFRASLLGLVFLPLAAALWMTAPFAVPPGLIVLLLFSVPIWACRNLLIQTPRHL